MIKTTEVNGNVTLTCTTCGSTKVQLSRIGYDCENGCEQKAYETNGGDEAFRTFLKGLGAFSDEFIDEKVPPKK